MANLNLLPNMTRDPKAHRFPQAIVKLNAAGNTRELIRRKGYDGDDVLFPTQPLFGEMGDAKILLSEGDVAYTMRSKGVAGTPANSERNFMNQDLSMKVNTALNGLKGSAESIQDMIEPCGIIEQGNEDTKAAKVNLLRGGSFTILYNGIRPSRENAWLRVRVPKREEADIMKTDKASHAQGRKGVVTLMYEEYNPAETTFLSVEKLAKLFNGEKHAYPHFVVTSAEKLVTALAKMHVSLSTPKPDQEATVTLIKERIIAAAKAPERHVDFISTINEFVQSAATARREQERMIIGKTQHATSNGLYTSIEAVRYAY